MPSWRIIFFGTPSFAVPTLKGLLEGPDEVVAAVTQPDRKKGRGQKVSSSSVKEVVSQSKERGILLFQPEKIKDEIFQERLRDLHPDLFVVAAYGQILPGSLLEIPRNGAINVHASLLPKYRGAAPIAWAILKGEEVTGVTIMRMDEGMDTGDILLQREILMGDEETAETLREKLASLGVLLVLETVIKMKRGEIFPFPQDHSQATYAPSLKKEDGRIDWRREAREIDRQVRAFNPWPGAYALLDGQFLKIFKGKVREGKTGERPGGVLWVGTDFIEVGTEKGSFLLKEVQLEGKRRMSIRDFLAGHPIPVGTVFQ
ncbi:MAG: methionyl-tRNA formyltransferase [Deltaproteobacteria bacterium RBG_16_48_10]|nr:MAG: methionyl-tRNA formyltransferase [Deltaproteobacteria bacterium RBG_16_48_10]